MVVYSPEGMTWFDVSARIGHSSAQILASVYERIGNPPSVEDIDPMEAFFVSNQLTMLRKQEHQACVQAIICFQAMMEGIINETVTEDARLSRIRERDYFADKWNTAFEVLGCDANARAHLDDYIEFYRTYRNSIIHPKPNGHVVLHSADYRFYNVYCGFYSGWHAFEALYLKRGIPHDENSWKIFTESNGLPAAVNEEDYPCLFTISRELRKKHINHVNNNLV